MAAMPGGGGLGEGAGGGGGGDIPFSLLALIHHICKQTIGAFLCLESFSLDSGIIYTHKNAMAALHAWSHSRDLLGELTLWSFTGLG